MQEVLKRSSKTQLYDVMYCQLAYQITYLLTMLNLLVTGMEPSSLRYVNVGICILYGKLVKVQIHVHEFISGEPKAYLKRSLSMMSSMLLY